VKRKWSVLSGITLIGFVLGCDGGGRGDGGGGFKTAVPGSKRLDELSAMENDQLCMETAAFGWTFDEDYCRLTSWYTLARESSGNGGLTDADLQATCEVLTNSCVGFVPLACPDLSCGATVGEFAACVSDYRVYSAATPPCSAMTRATLDATIANLDALSDASACKTIDNKCPGGLALTE